MSRCPSSGRIIATAAASLVLAACSSVRGVPPLWERESELPGDVSEDRAVFGLASVTKSPDGALVSAIRPFMVKFEDPARNSRLRVLPPFGAHDENTSGISTTVWPLYYKSSSGDEADRRAKNTDDDTWIFPILAWGDEPAEGSYFAAFPVYGTLKGKLLTDQIDFVAFPLYTHVRSDQWQSTHVLFPLIAWGESPTRSHFRVMPFWSQSDSPTSSSRTLIWPIGHWDTDKRGGRTFDSWFVFPLFGRRTSRDGLYSAWTALYPFFEHSLDEKTGDSYTSAPWPFYKHSVVAGQSESTWYWPLYGRYDSETEHSSFYAWPFVWSSDEVDGKRAMHRRYFVPFWMHWYNDAAGGPVDGPADEEELRSWPFFSWRRQLDGRQDVRIPEIIPVMAWEAGETCYADVLTLFRWRSDKQGREAWDGPLGTVRFRRDVNGRKTLTLLWWIDIPLGGGK